MRGRTFLQMMIILAVVVLAGGAVKLSSEPELVSEGNNENEYWQDGYLNDEYISDELCQEFLAAHEESLEYIINEIKKQPLDNTYGITFDNEGTLKIDKDLEIDEEFIAALTEIYTDHIFKLNPCCHISASVEENAWCFLDFRLFTNNSSYGGMIYHDAPMESYVSVYEVKLNDNWYWYCYPAL